MVEDQPLEATIEVHGGPLGLPGRRGDRPADRVAARARRSAVADPGGRWPTSGWCRGFPRRGLLPLPPPSLLVRDPLGLAERARRDGADRATSCSCCRAPSRSAGAATSAAAGGWRPARGTIARPSRSAAVDVDGLRHYRPGTPASRIHWQALARGAGLLERRLRADGDTRPLVVLDPRGAGAPELVDAAVRAAASITLELARSGGCGLLLPGEQRPTAIEPDLRELAGRASPGWRSSRAVRRRPRRRCGTARARRGPVFYVAAAPLERPPPCAAGQGSARRAGRRDAERVASTAGRARPMRPTLEVTGCRRIRRSERARARARRASRREPAPSVAAPRAALGLAAARLGASPTPARPVDPAGRVRRAGAVRRRCGGGR